MASAELAPAAELPERAAQKRHGGGEDKRLVSTTAADASSSGETNAVVFGEYELLEVLGRGGMGVVYRARQTKLDRPVAVKVLPFAVFSRPESAQRLRAEALTAASLQHPNIVSIHDVGEHQGQPFYSMDLVEGRTLAEVVRKEPLSGQRAAAYLKTIAEAVHYAHTKGVIHRDLKPSNVLIDSLDQPRITDFGLAKRLEGDSELTVSGQVLGSPNFMAPEQAAGSRALTTRADIYSLGALLYYLLTRQPPFQADSLTALLKQLVESEPVPPRLLRPGIPRDLETICLKCLEKEAGQRYASARALADDLGRFLRGEPIVARPIGMAGKLGKWCHRRPALAGTAAVALAIFVLGLAGVLWQWQRATWLAGAELRQRQRTEAGEYASDMHLAQLALENQNRALAVNLLNKHRPAGGPGSRDLRGWEWRYLWQLCQGDEALALHRYPGSIAALAVSTDAGVMAVATGQGTALWDLAARKPWTNLPGRAVTLAFSPAERALAIGTRNTTGPVLDIWDLNSKHPSKRITLPVGNGPASWSADGKLLAVFDGRGKVTISDAVSGEVIETIPAQILRSHAAGVAFSPNGTHLAIGEEYGGLRLVDLKNRRSIQIDTQTYCSVSALAFSPDSSLLVAGFGYGDGTIKVWDARTGEARGQMRQHSGDVTALAFSKDGERLVSASADGTIRFWRVADRAQLRSFQTPGNGLTSLALLHGGTQFVTGGTEGSICLWDETAVPAASHTNLWVAAELESIRDVERSGFLPGSMDPRAVRRLGVVFIPGSRQFIATDAAGLLKVWESQPLRLKEELSWIGSNYWGAAISPDARWLAGGDSTGKIAVWDWRTPKGVTNFFEPFDWYGSLRFSGSGHYLVAQLARNEEGVRFRAWRTADWAEIPLTNQLQQQVCAMDIAPDEKLLAVGYVTGPVKLFRWPSCEYVASLTETPGGASSVTFSPDGTRVAAARNDRLVRVWDVATRRQEASLSGHVNTTLGAAFSPGGRRLASSGATSRDAVKLWDPSSQRELLSLKADGVFFGQLAWSPDGNTLTASALSGQAHFWHAPSWEDIKAAEGQRQGSLP